MLQAANAEKESESSDWGVGEDAESLQVEWEGVEWEEQAL
jgi:hypothetical protein